MESNVNNKRGFLKGLLGLIHFDKKSPSYVMIIDIKRCMNCRACMVACKIIQKTPSNLFNTIIKESSKNCLNGKGGFMPLLCNHCEDPPCLKACPSNAILKLASGIVVTDWKLCDGKGYCVSACPFGMRHLDKENLNRSFKCDFCLERLEKGLIPKCVQTCPSGARIFGDLARPEGEFEEYISDKNLFSLGEKLKIKTRVFYTGID